MDKKTLYSFAMQIARFKIPPHENTKCQQSFFRFARELTAVRINMSNPEQQVQFDEEVRTQIFIEKQEKFGSFGVQKFTVFPCYLLTI